MTTPYVDPQTVHNPSAGTSPPASWGDTVREDLEFLARTPGCIARRSSNLSVPDVTLTAVPFNAGDLRDTDGYHSTVTNDTRVTVPAGLGGWYRLHGQAVWANGNADGYRLMRLRVNGSATIDESVDPGMNPGNTQRVSREMLLNAGDYLELLVFHNAGTPIEVNGTSFDGCVRLEARLVALA